MLFFFLCICGASAMAMIMGRINRINYCDVQDDVTEDPPSRQHLHLGLPELILLLPKASTTQKIL